MHQYRGIEFYSIHQYSIKSQQNGYASIREPNLTLFLILVLVKYQWNGYASIREPNNTPIPNTNIPQVLAKWMHQYWRADFYSLFNTSVPQYQYNRCTSIREPISTPFSNIVLVQQMTLGKPNCSTILVPWGQIPTTPYNSYQRTFYKEYQNQFL